MKFLFTLLTFLLPLLALAQKSKPELLTDINREVWLPFVQGVNTDNAKLYVGVRSKDFYWVAAGAKGRIMNLKEYDEDSKQVMQKRKAEGGVTEIEVKFLERNINADFAAEKCIVRFKLSTPGKEPQTGYGIAQYFSRKEKGVWKMWLQHALPERGTEELFNQALPMEEVIKA